MLAQLKERKDGHVSVRLFASIYSVVRFFMPHIASTFILNIFSIYSERKETSRLKNCLNSCEYIIFGLSFSPPNY